MTRALLAALAALPLALVLAAPATAQTLLDLADDLRRDGYYVEPGVPAQRDALTQAVDDPDTSLYAVVVDEAPGGGGADRLATELALELGGTVIVFTADELWAESVDVGNDQIEAALSAADDEVGSSGDAGEYTLAFGQALEEEGVAGTDGGGGGGGGGVNWIWWLVGGGAAALVGTNVYRSAKRRREAREAQQRSLEEARSEVRTHVAVLAEQIVALSDRVSLSDNEQARTLFNEASQSYQTAQQELDSSTSPQALERIADQLNHTRWQMESVSALIEGREPPPKPQREESCFFDPTHGAGTEEAVINTAAGDRSVRVCAADAAKLRAGETPEPRMVDVGGRRIPAAMAPRSYGGGGHGWLDDFVVIMGGHRSPYGWARYRTDPWSRGWGGGYGPGYSGGWTRGPSWDRPYERSYRYPSPRSSGWGGSGWGGGGWGGGGGFSSRGGGGRSRSTSGGGRSRSSFRSSSGGGRSRGGGGGKSRGGGGRKR